MKKIVLSILFPMCLTLVFSTISFSSEPIKIATVEPQSGNFKDIGERYHRGVEYAVKTLNEGGGILGRKIELFQIDSELKPDVAARKASKLILRDEVKYFFGGTGSSVGSAMASLAEKNDAIMVSYGMAAASMTGKQCKKNFFRVALNTDQHSYALAIWVAKSRLTKVATIAQDYSYGKEATSAFIQKLKERNNNAAIVTELYHKIGEKDFGPYITQLISSGAEIIFTPNWGLDLSLLIKQARSLGLNTKFACYDLYDEEVIKVVGNDDFIRGNITCESYFLEIPNEANKLFVEGFQKKNGRAPTWLEGKSYTAVMFWAEAIKKAKTDNVPEVIKAWEGMTYDSIAGKYLMRACDHQVQLPAYITEMSNTQSRFYKHIWANEPSEIPATEIEVPCEKTGCIF